MQRTHHQNTPAISVQPSINRPPQLIAQAQNSASTPLEEALDPRFSGESEAIAPQEPSYTGLLILSGLTFLFLIFLLFKRRLKEVRFGILATLLLGIALPIWTIIEITVDRLEQSTVQNSSIPSATVDPASDAPPPQDEPSPKSTFLGEATVGLAIAGTVKGFAEPQATEALPNPDEVSFGDGSSSTASDAASDSLAGTPDETRSHSTAIAAPPSVSTASNRPAATPRRASHSPQSPVRGAVNLSPAQGIISRPIPPLDSIDWTQPIAFRPFLKPRWRGVDVLVLQKILKDLGHYDGEIDGYYGPKTTLAVKAFQIANNLLDDGIVGFSTCEILDAQAPEVSLQCPE